MRSEGRGVGSRKKGIGASLRARSCARSKSTSSTCRGKGIVDMAIVGIGIGFRVIGWNRGSINSKSRSSCRSTTSSPKSRSTSNRVNSRGRNYNDFSLRFRSIALSRANASSGLNRPHSYYWNNAAKVAQDGPSLVKANQLYPVYLLVLDWSAPQSKNASYNKRYAYLSSGRTVYRIMRGRITPFQ